MVNRVYFRGPRSQARAIVRRLALMLTGRESDELGIAHGVFLSMGFAALSDIKADFVRKARGQVGEDGTKWPPLNPKTIAYGRRFGPGEAARLKRDAGLGRGNRHGPGGGSGLLTADQLKQWRAIYASRLRRFAASMPLAAAKGKAAAIAWAIMKQRGARTKLDVFGKRQVEMLRDTGILLNSLSPGYLGGTGPTASYSPPSGPGGDQQIMETMQNGVVVGTSVPYAASHQNGDPKRGVPARPFLPIRDIPEKWAQRQADAALRALEVGAKILFEAA